jgi:hypothetical protein
LRKRHVNCCTQFKRPTVCHFLAVFMACTLGLAVVAVDLSILAFDRGVDFRTDAAKT